MNFWSFAMAHPYITAFVFVAAVGSGCGVGVSFAKNKTPVIGTFSPAINFNVGVEEENGTNTDMCSPKEDM